MWRDKREDLERVERFVEALEAFSKLKLARWERVDESVQMAITPGSPSEDWIIPPDEGLTLEALKKDPDYVRLKKIIQESIPEVKLIAQFLDFDEHHDLDWVTFTTPLIGNAALEDGLTMSNRLIHAIERKNYHLQNFISLFKVGI